MLPIEHQPSRSEKAAAEKNYFATIIGMKGKTEIPFFDPVVNCEVEQETCLDTILPSLQYLCIKNNGS